MSFHRCILCVDVLIFIQSWLLKIFCLFYGSASQSGKVRGEVLFSLVKECQGNQGNLQWSLASDIYA